MRIPSADGFGQVVAEPARPDRRRDVTPESMGAGLARAVGGIAMDALQTQRREEERARQEQERVRQENIRLQDAADRANAVRLVHAGRAIAEAARDEFAEGIRSGKIPKAEASNLWKQRLNEIRTDSLEGVPHKFATDAEYDFDGAAMRFDRDITKALTERNQSEVRDGLNSTFESAQRLYMKDPAAANKMVDEAVATFGPDSGLSVEQLGKAKQSWQENTRFSKVSEMLVAARRDNKALASVEKLLNSDEFASMDPQRKVQLAGQIEGFRVANIQRAEAEAARARAQQEAALNKAEAAFNAANNLITSGKTLSPEYVTQLSEQTKGTPFAAALPDLLKQAPARSAFGMQPLAVMDQSINQLRAELNKRGTDPKTEKRVNELEAIRDQARKDYADDPLLAAQERGILQQVAPLDVSSVRSVVSSLGERVNQASLVAQQVGQPVSPLTAQEAEQVGKLIGVLPVDQRSSAIAQLAQAMGPQQAAALGRQMGPKDKPLSIALGLAGATTKTGRYSSELVLLGAQAIKDKAIKEDNAAVIGLRAKVAAEIGNAYQNEETRQTMIDAAVYAEYGLQVAGSQNGPAKAVNLVTGGIVERAGKKVPLPYGMAPADFEKRLKTLTVDSLRTALPGGKVMASGMEMDTADFLKQVPNAALIHAGQGRYAVQTGTGLATNANGVPLVFEVK